MTRFTWLVVSVALIAMLTGNLSAAELKVGDAAPDFELVGSDGKTYKLSDFKGKQAVVIAWFPKAFTGGCTQECKSFRENGKAIREFNVAYFTASVDTAEENKRFAESLELDYPILSDPGKKVAEAYGVVNAERKVPFRHTYYIGKDGKILHIDREVKAANHGKDLVEQLKKLGVETKG
ncbi:MAG TPA: peroxiredoxin [Planctomycetaceae bacterium]|nr:peroxiredoxin [Planctomycetaceae bacterium]